MEGNREERKLRREVNRLKYEARRWQVIATTGNAQKFNHYGKKCRQRKQNLRLAIYKFVRRRAAKKISVFFRWACEQVTQFNKEEKAADVICKRFRGWCIHRAERRRAAEEILQRFILSAARRVRIDSQCGKFPRFHGDIVPVLKAEMKQFKKKFSMKQNLPETNGNLIMFTYKDAKDPRMFEPGKNEVWSTSSLLRMEMRSLVVCKATGCVRARALPKFLAPGSSKSTRWKALEELRSHEVTIKRDGAMVFGVQVGDEMRLWTKGGLTEMAQQAEDWAGLISTKGQNVWGFLKAMHGRSCTVTMEYEGRQHAFGRTTSVGGAEECLIVVSVRENVSGRFFTHEEVCAAAAPFQLEVVERRRDLEGMGLREIAEAVGGDSGYEGVVVALKGDPRRFKIKTQWWKERQPRGEQRVEHLGRRDRRGDNEGDSWADRRRYRLNKKISQLNTRGQRVALLGLPQQYPPASLLEEPGVVRVEAFYNRESGKRGAVIASFRDPDDAEAVVRGGGKSRKWKEAAKGVGVTVTKAYSGRSCGAGFHRVSTWWRHLGDGESTKKKVKDGGQEAWGGYRWRLMLIEAAVVVPLGGVKALYEVARKWKHVVGLEEEKLAATLMEDLGGEDVVFEADIVEMYEDMTETSNRHHQGEEPTTRMTECGD